MHFSTLASQIYPKSKFKILDASGLVRFGCEIAIQKPARLRPQGLQELRRSGAARGNSMLHSHELEVYSRRQKHCVKRNFNVSFKFLMLLSSKAVWSVSCPRSRVSRVSQSGSAGDSRRSSRLRSRKGPAPPVIQRVLEYLSRYGIR